MKSPIMLRTNETELKHVPTRCSMFSNTSILYVLKSKLEVFQFVRYICVHQNNSPTQLQDKLLFIGEFKKIPLPCSMRS